MAKLKSSHKETGMHYVHPYGFSFDPDLHCEPGGGKSETVKGEAYTIAELYQKYQHGLIEPEGKNVMWTEEDQDFDDIDFDSMNSLDLVEREEMYNEIQEKAEAAKIRIEELKKEQQKQRESNKSPGVKDLEGSRPGSKSQNPDSQEVSENDKSDNDEKD